MRRARIAALVVALGAGPLIADTPPRLEGVGLEQRLGEKIPQDLPFRDDAGRDVRLGDYLGERPIVLALVYYECPMLCSLVLNGLTSSLGVLTFDAGRDFDVVAVSIDPGETPALAAAKKQSYVARYDREGGGAGWHFLTGDEPSIRALADAVGFGYRYDPEIDEYAHAAGIMIVAPDGTLARYFYGVEFSPKDLRLAMVEASKGQVGTVVDQVLLYCYRYDPATGKYSAAITRLVRLGAIVTVLGLVLFVGGSRLRERRRALRRMA